MHALPTSDLHILYEALICGVNLPAGEAKQLFVDTGLIHLMVVSGSHLVFIEILLGVLPRGGRLGALGAYCYLTGWQAPVMRAFLRRLIGPWLKLRSGLTSLQIEAASVALALLLYPEWLFSRSFQMSWMCGLALCSPALIPRWPHLDVATKAYVFLLPYCWASPASIAWNTLLAPFVGFILFPVCVAAMIVRPLVAVSDLLWRAFLGLLALGPHGEPLGLFFSAGTLCWVPVLTHALLLIYEVRWRRALAFSYSPTF